MIVLVGIFILGSEYLILQLMKILGPRMIFRRLFNSATIHEYFVNFKEIKNQNNEEICPICYLDFSSEIKIDWSTELPQLSDNLQDLIKSKKYTVMKTPCNHYFHISCLITVMNYKMHCPVCRTSLPEVDIW